MESVNSPELKDVLLAYPRGVRKRILFLRQLIFDVASKLHGVAGLVEVLERGEPAYRIAQSKHSITVRISHRNRALTEYAVQFNGKTDLINKFRMLFPSTFRYEGNSIVFDKDDVVPVKELRVCLFLALTHHRRKRTEGMRRVAARRLALF
jgi:hypothetical protein